MPRQIYLIKRIIEQTKFSKKLIYFVIQFKIFGYILGYCSYKFAGLVLVGFNCKNSGFGFFSLVFSINNGFGSGRF